MMNTNSSQIYNADFFKQHSERSLRSARIVLPELFFHLQPESVIDIGCGEGAWLKAAIELGASEVLGVDGKYVDPAKLMIDRTKFIAADLVTTRLSEILHGGVPGPFDLVMCLETAEHLPYERASSLIDDLVEIGETILFSAAIPFQSGVGHINEQWPEFWAIHFRSRGYCCYDWLRWRVWTNTDVDWWYAQNLLLFIKEGSAVVERIPRKTSPEAFPLALVHPENFLVNLLQYYRTYGRIAYNEEVEDLHALVRANSLLDSVVPSLMAVSRARSHPDAPDVFPLTRGELSDPERVLDDLQMETDRRLTVEKDLLREVEAGNRAVDALQRETNRRVKVERDLLRETEARLRAVDTLQQVAAKRLAVVRALEIERESGRQTMEALQLENARIEETLRQEATRRLAIEDSLVWRVAKPLRAIEKWALSLICRFRRVPSSSCGEHSVIKEGTGPCSPGHMYEFFQDLSLSRIECAIRLLRQFPPFEDGEYCRLNPDVSEACVDPATHFICYGSFEGRPAFSPERVARILGTFDDSMHTLEVPSSPDLASRLGSVAVYASSRGNVFMLEIAEDLVSDLREFGVAAELKDEMSPRNNDDAVSIFVAPHEFFTLGSGREWVREDVIRNAFMLNTEQLQTSWFARALPFVLMSRGVIDICPHSAELFRRTGLPALHFTTKIRGGELTAEGQNHALYRVLPADARCPSNPLTSFLDRPIDIAFYGTESPRRHRFFAKNAKFLSDFSNFIYLRPFATGPLKASGAESVLSALAAHVSGHSRITLNIHRDAFLYFEWHRMVKLGAAAGSVIVSEPCLHSSVLKPGTHYFEETEGQLPNLLDWLLRCEEGKAEAEKIRKRALAAISDENVLQGAMERFCTFLLGNLDR